jgi:hypothetical protein
MSEALVSGTDLSASKSREILHSAGAYGSENAIALPSLPAVQPGQLWYLQFPSTAPALAPLEYRALATANVVIYDGSLASIVAGFLPLGGYAARPGDGALPSFRA